MPEILCQPSRLPADCKIVLFSADGLDFYCCILWFGTVHNPGITAARVQAVCRDVLPLYEHNCGKSGSGSSRKWNSAVMCWALETGGHREGSQMGFWFSGGLPTLGDGADSMSCLLANLSSHVSHLFKSGGKTNIALNLWFVLSHTFWTRMQGQGVMGRFSLLHSWIWQGRGESTDSFGTETQVDLALWLLLVLSYWRQIIFIFSSCVKGVHVLLLRFIPLWKATSCWKAVAHRKCLHLALHMRSCLQHSLLSAGMCDWCLQSQHPALEKHGDCLPLPKAVRTETRNKMSFLPWRLTALKVCAPG